MRHLTFVVERATFAIRYVAHLVISSIKNLLLEGSSDPLNLVRVRIRCEFLQALHSENFTAKEDMERHTRTSTGKNLLISDCITAKQGRKHYDHHDDEAIPNKNSAPMRLSINSRPVHALDEDYTMLIRLRSPPIRSWLALRLPRNLYAWGLLRHSWLGP